MTSRPIDLGVFEGGHPLLPSGWTVGFEVGLNLSVRPRVSSGWTPEARGENGSMPNDDFREFVEQRYTALLRTAYLLCGSVDGAEDLLQTALAAALPKWRRMDHPDMYIRRIMVNHLVNRWRRPIREIVTAVLPDRAWRDDPVEDRDELWTALGRLPVRMRAVLVLRYWEDHSEQETARILGMSAGTVKSHASRGLARLRELVEPRAIGALTNTNEVN
jgi:RNA polymerase sigma-70 factor (sigma-E family)